MVDENVPIGVPWVMSESLGILCIDCREFFLLFFVFLRTESWGCRVWWGLMSIVKLLSQPWELPVGEYR